MKSERRHELQHNELADKLDSTITQLQPYIPAILGVIGLVIVAVLIMNWNQSSLNKINGSAWQSYALALATHEPGELEKVAEDFPKHDISGWALVTAGNYRLQYATSEIMRNKDNAARELQKAIDDYQPALEKALPPFCRQQALFGLARTYESMAATGQEDALSKATENYQKLVDEYPEGPFTVIADTQIKRLGTDEIKDFYAKFAAWEGPKPVSPSVGTPGSPYDFDTLDPSGQINMQDLMGAQGLAPSSGGSTIPGFEEFTPATDTPATDTPATDTPATDTPATDTPATDAPATDTPATDTPATDTPATDTPATEEQPQP